MTETITISKEEYEQMKKELSTLRHTKLYERLLQFEQNIEKAKFTRKDLGF
jgi:PHD/YefM family antitoxin component YafN of YafNO toxin-antitoxin module